MKRLLLTLAAAASLTINSHAALGWTLEQCKAAFGPIVKDDGMVAKTHRYFFHYNGYDIFVAIEQDGTCGAVVYMKDYLSEAELAGLMASNLPTGAKWDHLRQLNADTVQAEAIKDGRDVGFLMLKTTKYGPAISFRTAQNNDETDSDNASNAANM